MNICTCSKRLVYTISSNSNYSQQIFLPYQCKIWTNYSNIPMLRYVSNTSIRVKNVHLKELLKRSLKITSITLGVSILAFGGYSLMFEDNSGNKEFFPIEKKNVPFIIKMYERICFRIEFYHKMFTIPATNSLLPDPISDYYEKPRYTLVFEMTDLLVHPEWSYSTGWRFKKRPNVDYFLERVGKMFEVVVYTAENGYIASAILDKIDPNGWIQYRLSRQCTEIRNGQLVKNMERINRDLAKVIIIDWNSSWTQLQPRNTLIIPRWNGDDNDNSLIDLADFLKVVFENNHITDVREILKDFSQYDDPIKVFRENQRILEKETTIIEDKIEENEKEITWFSWIPRIY